MSDQEWQSQQWLLQYVTKRRNSCFYHAHADFIPHEDQKNNASRLLGDICVHGCTDLDLRARRISRSGYDIHTFLTDLIQNLLAKPLSITPALQ